MIESIRAGIARMAVKSVSLALVASIVALGTPHRIAIAGAAAGAVASGFYALAFVRSHVARAGRTNFYDSAIARSAGVRMLVVAVGGAGSYLLGEPALVAYLITFAFGLAVLVVSEIPRAKQQIRARGLSG